MKDWFGKAYDYLVQSLGNLIVPQKWTDYKKWTDFSDGKWITLETLRTIGNYANPSYKFFWWYLRYAIFVRKISGILKLGKIEKTSVHYLLQILTNLRQTGMCLFKAIYKLQIFNLLKVLSQSLSSLRFWIISTGTLKTLGQGLTIIRIPLQILEIIKVFGFCDVIIKILVQTFGTVKIQGNACATEYVSWQHFGTWQDWANTTGGKWYYMC